MEAGKALVTLMDLNMLVQVSLLCEGKATAWEVALIRSFVCVNSEVIEEIVPFSEHFAAIVVCAA